MIEQARAGSGSSGESSPSVRSIEAGRTALSFAQKLKKYDLIDVLTLLSRVNTCKKKKATGQPFLMKKALASR